MSSVFNTNPYFSHMFFVFSLYLVLNISPGPANMAIMTTSMRQGRRSGIALACGVITGSQFWGNLAALGMTSLLISFPFAIKAIGIAGGLYFLWLGYKAACSALSKDTPKTGNDIGNRSFWQYYFQGLGIHLLNPKAILSWISIITLGVSSETSGHTAFIIVLGGFIIGSLVFGTYAIAFSTPVMIRLYARARRWIQAVVAIMFAATGIGLLISY